MVFNQLQNLFLHDLVFYYLYKMILVTGATGLVGSNLLLKLLQSELQVRAIYRNLKSLSKTKALFAASNAVDLFLNIDWVEADLNDVTKLEKAFNNVTLVYHCAALISFDPKDEIKLRKINIEGTANIVNFCVEKNIKKLCFVSSIAALGQLALHENQITETTEWNPYKQNSDYAISKYGAEMEVWRGHQEGLKVIIINPGVIFGTGFFNEGSNVFFSKVKKGILFYTNGSTGFVGVKDVVEVLIALMNSEISGERFIVIAENRTYKSIFETIAHFVKAKKPMYAATPFLTNLYWRFDWIKSFLFQQKRSFSKYNSISAHTTDLISNKKLVDAINYNFENMDTCIAEVATNFNQTHNTL